MPDSEAPDEAADEVNALSSNASSLEELMAGAPLWRDGESFEIEDMTDEEWQVFVDALDE